MAHESLAEINQRAQVAGNPFPFGAGGISAALRALADAIDSEAVLISKAEETQTVALDEFTARSLVVVFHDRKEI